MNSKDSITLNPREQQRLAVLNHVLAGHWSVDQAAGVLCLSVRQVWRLLGAYRRIGVAALAHGNRGRPSTTKLSLSLRQRIIELVQSRYAGCNDSHLVELLALREDIVVSRPSLQRLLRGAGLGPARPRRAPRHRRRRERAAQAGMLLQIDGSPHHWLGPDLPRLTLLGAIDDASGQVVGAVFRQQEDAHGYFVLLDQVLHTRGLPLALYHDRHGIFQRDPKQPWTLDEQLHGRPEPTQFGRALQALGIGSIAARSPQAKGRIERLWGTLQGRLVAELRLAGIDTLQAANAFLPAFLARHNARFADRPDDPGSAYRPLDPALDLDSVLSFRYRRVVAHDNTVRFARQLLQIPPGPARRGYPGAHVFVHELLDGSFGVWHQDRWLLRTPAPELPPTIRARQHHPPTPELPPRTPRPVAPKPASCGPRKPSPNHPWRNPSPRREDLLTESLSS